jgi:hypothetical protein
MTPIELLIAALEAYRKVHDERVNAVGAGLNIPPSKCCCVPCEDAEAAVERVKAILVSELLAEQRTTRRLTALTVILFCGLCWLEGWRAALWLWRLL